MARLGAFLAVTLLTACGPQLSGPFHVLTDVKPSGTCETSQATWPVFPALGAWWQLSERERTVTIDMGQACSTLVGDRTGERIAVRPSSCVDFTSSGATVHFEWTGGSINVGERFLPSGNASVPFQGNCRMILLELDLEFSATGSGGTFADCSGRLTGSVNQLIASDGCPTS